MPNLRRDHVYNALFILDEIPRAIIDDVIMKNREYTGGYFFWLAEVTFDSLPSDDTDDSIAQLIGYLLS
ncbi:hypothetical protein KCU86_g2108, partial [Aureobasidium melanogenum]